MKCCARLARCGGRQPIPEPERPAEPMTGSITTTSRKNASFTLWRRPAALVPLAALMATTLAGCATQPASEAAIPATRMYDVNAILDGRDTVQFTKPAGLEINAPTPDPRVGLAAGMFDAEEAIWNLRMHSTTPPPDAFVGGINSDLAFTGKYAIQGNFNGIQVWDISDPANPVSVVSYVCPASQSDVSVYEHLLFVSGRGQQRASGLRRPGNPGGRGAMSGFAGSASSTSPISPTPSTSRTYRRAAVRTRTRCSSTPGTTRTSTSTCRVRRQCGQLKSCPDARGRCRRKIPIPRSSGSR